MSEKFYIPDGECACDSQIGASLEALAATIAARRDAGAESYTYSLMFGPVDKLLKKVCEEACEVALAAKDVEALCNDNSQSSSACARDKLDAALDHLRYESADVVYHLLVVLERYGISIDEFAAELNARMTTTERPQGGALIKDSHINRG